MMKTVKTLKKSRFRRDDGFWHAICYFRKVKRTRIRNLVENKEMLHDLKRKE